MIQNRGETGIALLFETLTRHAVDGLESRRAQLAGTHNRSPLQDTHRMRWKERMFRWDT